MAERRSKEIGVRKVLGASVAEIVAMLTKEFAKWYADMGKYDLDYPKNVVVVGTSDITEAKYLLVVPDANAEKKEFESLPEEWPVMYLSESSDYVYDDFWDFLKKSEEMYKELVEDEDL